jgi:hypothetical protein
MLEAGLAHDTKGKAEADRRIRAGLHMMDANCPEVWAKVKKMSAPERLDILRKA